MNGHNFPFLNLHPPSPAGGERNQFVNHRKGEGMFKIPRVVIGIFILMIAAAAWSSPVPETGVTQCYNETTDHLPVAGSGFLRAGCQLHDQPDVLHEAGCQRQIATVFGHILDNGERQRHRSDLGDEDQQGWGNKLQRSSRCRQHLHLVRQQSGDQRR